MLISDTKHASKVSEKCTPFELRDHRRGLQPLLSIRESLVYHAQLRVARLKPIHSTMSADDRHAQRNVESSTYALASIVGGATCEHDAIAVLF